MATNKIPKICLIDGSGYIFRAFYGIPPMNRADGMPTNAVYGFANMLWQIHQNYQGTHLAVVFDSSRKTFRSDIYPEYKSHRKDTPEALIPQFPFFRQCVQAFNIPSLEMVGFEADDLIATLAQMAHIQGLEVEIYSADKDLMQLMKDGINLIDPMKNKRISREDVIEKFGVPPELVVEVQACMGDTSDNVPGFPGIGVKTAAQLILQYGSLENLIAHCDEIPQQKRRDIIKENANLALISKQLVQLKSDIPLDYGLDDLQVHHADHDKMREFFALMEFKSLLNRVPSTKSENLSIQSSEISQNYQLISHESELKLLVAKIMAKQRIIAFDTETTHLTPALARLVGISIALDAGEAYYIPCGHGRDAAQNHAHDLFAEPSEQYQQIPLNQVIELLKPIFTAPHILKIAHNIKYDWAILAQYDIRVAPFEDTLLLDAALFAGQHGHSLNECAKLYFNYTMKSFKELVGSGKNEKKFNDLSPQEALFYAAEDADFALRLYEYLYPLMLKAKLMGFYQNIEHDLPPVVAQMELNGIMIDKGELAKLAVEFSAKITTITQEIYDMAGMEFNIASPKQLGEVLFEKMAIIPPKGSGNKSGGYSTALDVLEQLADENPIIAKILEFRHYSKLNNTYALTLPNYLNPKNQRIHCHFSLTGAQTGRLSCSEPNLQNIPIKGEDGKKIRACFVAPANRVLISLDYSQIELRILAQMAKIPTMIEGFLAKNDIHRVIAAKLHHITIDQVSPEQRSAAKAINFGIIYGMSAFGLAKQLNISQRDAKNFIDQYNQEFNGITEFMGAQIGFAKSHNFVQTMAGRRIAIKYINDKNHGLQRGAERQAMNAPIQGTAADIIKLAMIKIADNLPKDCQLLLQVHDELVIESPSDKAEENAKILQNIMEHSHEKILHFDIPLSVDYTIKKHWD